MLYSPGAQSLAHRRDVEGVLRHRLRVLPPGFLIPGVSVRTENLHLSQVPGAVPAAGPGATLGATDVEQDWMGIVSESPGWSD